jgi:2-dehydropantoate 2-reductase
MTKIKTVSIIGAGAMGAAYASMFLDASGFSVSFVARGKRYERLKKKTFHINERLYHIPAIHADQVKRPSDLVLVALKHHHLPDAVNDIRALVGENTAIVSVMNGLESEKIIGTACGMDKLVYAIAVGIDAVYENDRYTYASPGKIVFGPMDKAANGPSLERIQEALSRAGIPNEIPDDILRAMWWKFMVNVGINQTSAVLKAPYGVFQAREEAQALMSSLMEEVVAVAQKAGVNLSNQDVQAWHPILMDLSPGGKTSMLQDVEAGRKTEVEMFADKVVELGREFNVPTPVNETVGRIIKVLELRSLP